MEAVLRDQWIALRAWLNEADVLRHRDRPSGSGTWSVGDLVAHLGLSLGMITEITPAPAGAVPLSLRQYIAAYPPAATDIAALTHDLARDLAADLLGGLDQIAERAWHALEKADHPLVMGRRGPLTMEDYLTTRLLELVVHGDDLHRVLPDPPPSPVLDPAAEAVSDALAGAYRDVAQTEPDTSDRIHWIRLAAGRVPSRDGHLPLL